MAEFSMDGFQSLELGMSTKFRQMWFKLKNPDSKEGTLRVEFHNRKRPQNRGAIYDYNATEAFVKAFVEHAQRVGIESVGSMFHKEVIAKPEEHPFTLVAKAVE
jgi:hypothetical protein